MNIRIATEADAAALAAIYAPYVTGSVITFEYDVPDTAEFAARIRHTLNRYPYLVAEEKGEPIGYAYAGALKTRDAYDWAAETSIYLKQTHSGQGRGRTLYQALEALLKRQHVLNLYACITHPNEASEHFHRRQGYHKVAHFTHCGYKFGQWCDVIWMEKRPSGYPEKPAPFIPFPQLADQSVK